LQQQPSTGARWIGFQANGVVGPPGNSGEQQAKGVLSKRDTWNDFSQWVRESP